MNQQEFAITIDKTGKVQLHIKGVKGKKCLEVAKMFAQIVGKMGDPKLTAEYYEPETVVGLEVNLENKDN
jgi:hypothetical protein